MRLAEQRRALVAAGERLAARGLVTGSSGNLSIRAGNRVVVTPSGLPIAGLTPDQMVIVDLAGKIIEGDLTPTSETPLHLAVYAATDALAITHTHALASTAVSCVCAELPPIHYNCLALGGPIRVAPYATFGSTRLADNVVETLGTQRNAVLMQNHGSLAFGEDLDRACDRLELVEWLCELHERAYRLGAPRVLTTAELDDVAATMAALRYSQKR